MRAWSRRLSARELPLWDRDFIGLHLDARGQLLFAQMDPADQRHGLAVAKSALAKRGYQLGAPVEYLVQAALLHDIGKVAGDLTPLTRICVGFLRRFLPRLRARLAKRDGTPLQRACYVDLRHAARGAYMARAFGIAPDVVQIIRAHHDPPAPYEAKILTYLREADRHN